MIFQADVRAAADRIQGRVRETPVIRVTLPSTGTVWLKLEQLQHTGSFKARGATNRVLAAGELPSAGVLAASGGNHGLAVAHAAASRGVPATVFVPETAPEVKVARLRELGAEVRGVGTRYAQAFEAALTHAERTGALFCHAYDQPETCAGQGTLGTELLAQTGTAVDTILLAVGGGGLLAGVAAAVEGRARVVGVEPASIPTLHAALAEGAPVDVPVSGVAADSLGASRLGEISYAVASRTGAGSVLIDDADIVAARGLLWSQLRLAVEHGTAAALAALCTGAYRPADGERVAVVLCGGNTDPATL